MGEIPRVSIVTVRPDHSGLCFTTLQYSIVNLSDQLHILFIFSLFHLRHTNFFSQSKIVLLPEIFEENFRSMCTSFHARKCIHSLNVKIGIQVDIQHSLQELRPISTP